MFHELKEVLWKNNRFQALRRSETKTWDLGPLKVGPGTPKSGNRDPPQSLKVGPENPLKFKSVTPGSLQNLIVLPQDPLEV